MRVALLQLFLTGCSGYVDNVGPAGVDGADGQDGEDGEDGVSSRTLLRLELDPEGQPCLVAPGDGTVSLRAECCPADFSLVGAQGGHALCLEDAPARARVALVLDLGADLQWCDEAEGDCCPLGYEFLGWAEGGVVCLER